MAWFRCSIRGENFPLSYQGEIRLMGFYATRFVEAASAEIAEQTVLEILRADPSLRAAPGATNLEAAQIVFEKIDEVSGLGKPNAGFTFFLQDQD